MFRSEFFFRTTQELEYLFILWREARNFFPEFNIRLHDKNSESDFFFFLHQNQNIFFSNIGNQNIFLEKNHNPPPFKLNGRSLNIQGVMVFKAICNNIAVISWRTKYTCLAINRYVFDRANIYYSKVVT